MWKSIEGFEGYEISDCGQVRSKRRAGRGKKLASTWRLLRPKKNSHGGHLEISLCKDGERYDRFVHTLVLCMFVGRRPNGMQCRHLDGNPENNHVGNLCWGTPLENGADKIAHGRSTRGRRNVRCVLTEHEVKEIRKMGATQIKIASHFGISRGQVGAIRRGVSWGWLT
jgi:hypothetical protein